jgi:Calcineurin-like phosphoesterase
MESTYPRTRASVVVTSQPIVLNRTRVFVTGDIHGRSDLLDRMVDYMSRDLDNPTSDCVTVTLGDYIDRGPDSRGVLDRLVRNPFPTALVALKGNHEAPLEIFSNDPAMAEHRNTFIVSRRWLRRKAERCKTRTLATLFLCAPLHYKLHSGNPPVILAVTCMTT